MEDQQVVPPTWSLFWHQTLTFVLTKAFYITVLLIVLLAPFSCVETNTIICLSLTGYDKFSPRSGNFGFMIDWVFPQEVEFCNFRPKLEMRQAPYFWFWSKVQISFRTKSMHWKHYSCIFQPAFGCCTFQSWLKSPFSAFLHVFESFCCKNEENEGKL